MQWVTDIDTILKEGVLHIFLLEITAAMRNMNYNSILLYLNIVTDMVYVLCFYTENIKANVIVFLFNEYINYTVS